MADKTDPLVLPVFQTLYHQQGVPILFLARAIQNKCIHHAYIIKSELVVANQVVQALAQALMCLEQGCQQCATCRQIQENNHPDLHWIRSDAESKSNTIRVAQIKELLTKAAFCPVQAPFQFFVIEGAEFLNVESSNALLKTLEEPPAATVFLLLTHYVDKILPTIHSRSQLLVLNQWSEQTLNHQLFTLKSVLTVTSEKQRQDIAEQLAALNYQELLLQMQFLQREFWQQMRTCIQAGRRFEPTISAVLDMFERYLQALAAHANPKIVIALFMAEFSRLCRPLKEWLP